MSEEFKQSMNPEPYQLDAGGSDHQDATGVPNSIGLLGTALQITNYNDFTAFCEQLAVAGQTFSIEFANTQVVTMRRHELTFRAITDHVDYFVPDGMPLIWCLNQ